MKKKILIFLAAFLTFSSLSHAGTIQLPQTGQTTCYDSSGNAIACAGTGQDGANQTGASWPGPRFTDHGNGTVTDNLTGLMWLKDANCLGTQTWANALIKVADFNANPGTYTCSGYTANHSDWVLPDINELETLVNAEQANSATWLNTQGFINVQSGGYWSGSTYASSTGNAWLVRMYYGLVSANDKSSTNYVWPVRAGQ